jgi:F-type H+-transporting ATPase subunit gamma
MALKDVKAKIQATKRTNKVTRAMEAVSAAKMRKTQQTALGGRPYARAALSVLARLSGSADLKRNPLAEERTVKNSALVVITSDKGLAGGLNSGVIKAAAAAVAGKPKDSIRVYAYGRKGEDYFARREYHIAKSVENKRDDVDISLMEELARELSEGFIKGEFDEVVAVYSNFKSTFEQKPIARRLLPLSLENMKQLVSDIIPARGKWSNEAVTESPATYEVEPSAEVIIDVLVPKLVAVSLYHMLLEGKASEHSARMVAMKNASDKSKEVAHALTRTYNKIRQAAITREVSEIVGGREALAN